MNVAIDIPDDIGQVLASRAGGISRVVLEAVAIEAYQRWHDYSRRRYSRCSK